MSETGMVPYSDLTKMAESVVKSGMFPNVKTTEAAITLFLICQSEGLHPLQAMMRYNIIQGRPAMKAEAMLASFMERGGTVEWVEYTNEAVTAVFVSQGVPKGVKVRWTIEDAKRAGITANPTWTKYPKQMLKARVASDGVRMADPTVNQGRYTPEEVQDFAPRVVATEVEIVPPEPPQEARKALAGGEAEGEAAISGGGSEPEPEPPAESIFKAPPPTVPGHCTLKGCGGELSIYKSTQEKHPGREYWQCEKAHAMVDQALLDGSAPKTAAILVSQHYRQWVE